MESTKKKKKPAKALIVLGIIFLVILSAAYAGFNIWNRNKIKDDIENKLFYVKKGNLEWVELSGADVAGELVNAVVAESREENLSFPNLIIANTDVEYKIGIVTINSCKVKFQCSGYSVKDYLSYCHSKGITDKRVMTDSFRGYMNTHGKDYQTEVKLTYRKKDGRWYCDYNEESFLNGVSGGMIEVYQEYYNDALEDIGKFIEILEENTEGEESEEQ